MSDGKTRWRDVFDLSTMFCVTFNQIIEMVLSLITPTEPARYRPYLMNI